MCLYIDDSDRRIPIKFAVGEVKGVAGQKARRDDTSDQIKIALYKEDSSLVLQDFASSESIDSALALLEHITS